MLYGTTISEDLLNRLTGESSVKWDAMGVRPNKFYPHFKKACVGVWEDGTLSWGEVSDFKRLGVEYMKEDKFADFCRDMFSLERESE